MPKIRTGVLAPTLPYIFVAYCLVKNRDIFHKCIYYTQNNWISSHLKQQSYKIFYVVHAVDMVFCIEIQLQSSLVISYYFMS